MIISQVTPFALKPVRSKIHFHGLVAYPVGLGFPPTRYEPLGYELREGNDRPLEEGMAFHVVMSLRKFAQFGVSRKMRRKQTNQARNSRRVWPVRWWNHVEHPRY
jgi:hypothetical protein